jgi:hypothetical protein
MRGVIPHSFAVPTVLHNSSPARENHFRQCLFFLHLNGRRAGVGHTNKNAQLQGVRAHKAYPLWAKQVKVSYGYLPMTYKWALFIVAILAFGETFAFAAQSDEVKLETTQAKITM